MFVEFSGLRLNVNWEQGKGLAPERLPNSPGVYAEIYWPELGVRIGETGNSIRGKIKHDIRWFEGMKNGTEKPEQLRRTLPIALAAKRTGKIGFEFFVVCSDPRLSDKALRQDCERVMFDWVRKHPQFVDWNRQTSWR